MATQKYSGKVYSIDWFQGSEKTNLEFAGKYFNTKRIFKENIAQFGIGEHIELIDKPSEEACDQFSNDFFDFVFFDADHRYPNIKRDIEIWLPKVKKGGLLIGHDCEVVLTEGIDTLYSIFNDVDIINVLHLGVCRAVSELGGQKTRSLNMAAPHESMASTIWYYEK